MTTATETTRRIEDICPPWCSGHRGMYQSWDDRSDGGGQERFHAEHGTSVDPTKVFVTLLCVESDAHTLSAPIIDLLIDGYGGGANTDLTVAQARELAEVLVSAADRAEARA